MTQVQKLFLFQQGQYKILYFIVHTPAVSVLRSKAIFKNKKIRTTFRTPCTVYSVFESHTRYNFGETCAIIWERGVARTPFRGGVQKGDNDGSGSGAIKCPLS